MSHPGEHRDRRDELDEPADGRTDEREDERGAHPGERDEQRRGGFWAGVKEVVSIAVTALVISFLIKTFLAQAFWIPSGSMEDTLVYGDRVMVSKIQAGPMGIDRGDIVVFEDPGGWLPKIEPDDRGPVMNAVMDTLAFVGLSPVAEGNHLIKRVIGVAGDHVVCCDANGRVTVNGTALDETYLFPGDEPSTAQFDITVPEDSIWVMGDHRSNSSDSRAHDIGSGGSEGSVPVDHVVGQAFALIFPFTHATWFENPPTFQQVPAPSK